MDPLKAVLEVMREYKRARKHFPPFRSAHEAEAVLWEKMDELATAVRVDYRPDPPNAATPQMLKEARQLAAMALAFLIECPKAKRS